MDTIRSIVIEQIAKEMLLDEQVVRNHGNKSLEQLGIDSLKAITILYRLEDIYEIEFPNSSVEKVKTVDDITKLIETIIKASLLMGAK